MARENSATSWLAKARLIFRDDLHLRRVELQSGKGFPDLDGSLQGYGPFQAEAKSSERPAKPDTPIRFKVRDREAQIEYLRRRRRAGGKAWLFLQVGSGSKALRYLIDGLHAEEVYGGVIETRLLELSVVEPKADQQKFILAMASL